MRRLDVLQPKTLAEALVLKAKFGCSCLIIAGGTDQMIALREGSAAEVPVKLIDISRIAELRGVAMDAEESNAVDQQRPRLPRIQIGALATHSEIESNPLIERHAPLLATAAGEVGSPQIRNLGTIGGNICNGAPCADTLPALLALDATVTMVSTTGTRTIPVAEFLPATYSPALRENEIVTSFEFDAIAETAAWAFVKLGRRNALSLSRMSIAVIVAVKNGIIEDARVAAGSVAPTARRFGGVEQYLIGEPAGEETFTGAGRHLAETMIEITGRRWSTPYKEPVVAALLRRALRKATGFAS